MSAVYTPLFDKIQRHTHRYSTNISGIHPAIRQGRRAQLYTPIQRLAAFAITLLVCLLAAEKETTARAGDPCNAAQHCRCHPVGLQQKVAATHAVNHIGPLTEFVPSVQCEERFVIRHTSSAYASSLQPCFHFQSLVKSNKFLFHVPPLHRVGSTGHVLIQYTSLPPAGGVV